VYSGLHVSSAEGLKFTDFKHIQPAGVYVYPVQYKRRRYHAAISKKAFERLNSANPHDSELVVYQKPNAKTKFDVNFRIKMSRMIADRGLQHVMGDKSIFESMRKFTESQFNVAGLPRDDVRLLLGLRPKSVAYKHEINNKGEKVPLDLAKRAAEAYAKTHLNKFELWK
jgi:predicted double-glycine peptidase